MDPLLTGQPSALTKMIATEPTPKLSQLIVLSRKTILFPLRDCDSVTTGFAHFHNGALYKLFTMKIIVLNYKNPRIHKLKTCGLKKTLILASKEQRSQTTFTLYTDRSHVLWKLWQSLCSVTVPCKSCARNQDQDVPDTFCPRRNERTYVKSHPLWPAPRKTTQAPLFPPYTDVQIPPILVPTPPDRRCSCTLLASHAPKNPPVGNSKPPNVHRVHERRPGTSQNNSLFLSPAAECWGSTQSLSPQSM